MRNTVKYVKGVDKKINSHKEAVSLLYPSFRRLDHEEVWIFFIDNANNPIAKQLLNIGSFDSTSFDIRRIVKNALAFNAAGIIVCHNHLSDVNPSVQDIKNTHKLHEALQLFDITLVDHIILNENEYYSISEEERFELCKLQS